MCEFCTEHGEGKVWYLAAQNYNQELLNQDGRREHITEFFKDFELSVARSLSMLDKIQALPFVPAATSSVVTARQKKSHFGQVVPVEDVDQMLDLVDTVVRLPCVCRSLTTGRTETRYCYGFGIDPSGLIGHFPDYGENLEWLTPEDARTAIHKLDKEGLVHSVWTFDTPFIGGLCNCDQDCMAYRLQICTGMAQVFFPAEYVAQIDWDACSGCRLCRGQCPFGAIRYTASDDKCLIDHNLCYGCGVCRASCKKEAISLEPRKRMLRWQQTRLPTSRYSVNVSPCREARECRVCIDVCPSHVFGMVPLAERAAGVRAGDWQVQALLPSRCTNCGACTAACPQQVITVN